MKGMTTMADKLHGPEDSRGFDFDGGLDLDGDLDRPSQEALAQWALDRVGSGESSGDLSAPSTLARTRDRLLASLASEERFRPFYAELDRYFAIGVEALCAVLRKIEDGASYEPSPIPGVRFFHFAPGAGAGFAEAGIVKLAKGARFPRHQHLGDEVNFILEGTLIDAGVAYGPGSAVVNAAGSAHDYSAGPDRALILVAGHNGITFLSDVES